MRRHVRIVGVAAAGIGASLLLAGCEQQSPKITVQEGSFSTTITPSSYCFDRKNCRTSQGVDLPTVTAGPDSSVLIDVPREVEGRGWQVQALTLNGQRVLGGSGPISDHHSYRVVSGVGGGNPFIVQVEQLENSRPDGSRWSFFVKVSTTRD